MQPRTPARLPFPANHAKSLFIMPQRPSNPSPLSKPDRRQFLAGLALGASLGPALAQPAPAPRPAAQPRPAAVPPLAPIQDKQLSAASLTARLTGAQSPESTLFRFLPDPPPVMQASPLDIPTLRFQSGSDARIGLRNDLAQPLALALRGLRRPLSGDAMSGIGVGQAGSLAFPTSQPGSFLLKAVPPAPSREARARGLHALVVLEEPRPPDVDHDIPLLVGDWRLNEKGELAGDFADLRDAARLGRLGNRLSVNGRTVPLELTVRPGSRLRLRLANVAPARTIPLHALRLVARVIAIDSTPCAPFDPLQRMVTLAPGNRCEMIVDVPREAGIEARVEARFATPAPLFILRTEGEPVTARGPVTALPDPGLPAAIRLQNAARAELAITGGWPREASPDPEAMRKAFPDPARIFQLNVGALGDGPGAQPGKPLLRVKRGREVVLALKNQTAWPQVLGLDGHSFRLLHPYDDGWEPYFLDTVHVGPGQILRIAFIAELVGRHALRSTIADHAETGVATHLEVTG
ncbi:MAG: multicopper oxidase domain-containing protein [Methylobacterium sp.]|nr:multicopper oxidase domain-containing protein [Methylobacterium sp.]